MSVATRVQPVDTDAAEWDVRVDLAALYRLAAHHGFDDAIFTHISARVPGNEPAFLINPYGLFFHEITASSLVKIDLDGNVLSPGEHRINRAGFTIHSAVHAARPDAHFVIHLHTDHGVAVSAQAEGLLPLTQHSLIVLPTLAYHDFEGIAVNLAERERIVADLGDKSLMLLRNHGTLAVGATAADAWVRMHYLERACRQQVYALSAGRGGVALAPPEAQREVARLVTNAPPGLHGTSWPGYLRLLDKHLPGYDS